MTATGHNSTAVASACAAAKADPGLGQKSVEDGAGSFDHAQVNPADREAPVPARWTNSTVYSQEMRVEVDGELFVISIRPDRPGQYDFSWVSGPNPGYGFSSSTSEDGSLTDAQVRAAIRGFLAQIDPDTGYIE